MLRNYHLLALYALLLLVIPSSSAVNFGLDHSTGTGVDLTESDHRDPGTLSRTDPARTAVPSLSILGNRRARTYAGLTTGISLVKDLFQIGFFILIGAISLLTYIKARKTLLQPIRTEIFKEQLKLFQRLLSYFTGKSELELREVFAFEELFHVNCLKLLDDYASSFFGIEIERDGRPYNTPNCPETMVSLEDAERYFELDTKPLRPEAAKQEPRSDARTRAATWRKYKYSLISLPRRHLEARRELANITDSPLLPKGYLLLVEDYVKTVHENVSALGQILTECAARLPEKYPTAEHLQKASTGWIWNQYNRGFQDLEEKATSISSFVREYFSTDTLLK